MNEERQISINNKKRLTFSFLAVIIMLVLAQIIRQLELSKQTNYASTINIAGKQRMLSQFIAKNIALKSSFQSFKYQFFQLKETHDLLKKNSQLTYSKSVFLSYQKLDLRIEDIEKKIFCYKESACDSPKLQKELIDSLDLFLKEMDLIVNQQSTEVESIVHNFRVLELLIFSFILFVIIFKNTRIIFPMHTKLLNIITNYAIAKESNKKIEKAASIGSWDVDIKTEIITWSDEVYKIHALKKEDNINKMDAMKFYKEEDRAKLLKYIDDAIKKNRSYDDEFEFIDSNGNEKWVRSIGEPILDENNRVEKIVGIFQDITQMKRQELRVKEAAQTLRIAIEGANIAIWKWDFKHREAECDESWYKLYGIKPGNYKEDIKAWNKSLHPSDITRVYEQFNQFIKKAEGTFETIHRNRDKKGNWKYILSRGKFTDNKKDGKKSLFIGTCQDITDTIKSQNEQKFILESLDLGIIKWNIPTNYVEWDDYVYSLYGYSKTDYPTAFETWQASLGKDREETTQYLKDEIARSFKEDIDLDATFPIVTSDGKKKFIGVKATFEKDEKGEPVYMYGINWDKTNEVMSQLKLEQQRKKAEQNAKLANIGEMAAGIGHEINNPLSVIKGYAGILKQKSPSENLDKILNASLRIEKIVSGLRQFVRSTENDNEEINLKNILQTTYDTLFELYAKENINLEISLNSNGLIQANFGRVQQVIVNLISNAKDAVKGSSNAKILISLTETNDQYQINITDNGPGIPLDLQEKIFDPFFTTKDVNEGTGIGLSLAASITKEYKGTLSFKSNSKGSIFTLTFSKVLDGKVSEEKEEHTSQIKKEEKESAQTINKEIKVLCIDDEEEILDILKFYLEEIGVAANTFSDPKKAYQELINKNDYDLVITDLQMPQLNGMELVSMIRENESIKQPKIIISTGGVNINIEDKNSKISNMVDSYLFKPYDLDKLQESIESCEI